MFFCRNMLFLPTLKTAGLILAAGEPHQKGTSNGLLPLGNGETSVTRLAAQMRRSCDQLFCLIRAEARPSFQQAFQEADIPVELVERDPLNNKRLYSPSDAVKILRDYSIDWVHQVDGSIVFEKSVVEGMLSEAGLNAKVMTHHHLQNTANSYSFSIRDFISFSKNVTNTTEFFAFMNALNWSRSLECISFPIITSVSTTQGLAEAQAHFASSN